MEGVEKCITEINCNGMVQVASFSDSINEVSVRLEEDLHNANDCSGPCLEQEEGESCGYSQSTGGSENRIEEAGSDSSAPLITEAVDSMVCQGTSSDEQYLSEQQINNLQESIRAEIPSEDENENNGASENNKGIVCGFCVRNKFSGRLF